MAISTGKFCARAPPPTNQQPVPCVTITVRPIGPRVSSSPSIGRHDISAVCLLLHRHTRNHNVMFHPTIVYIITFKSIHFGAAYSCYSPDVCAWSPRRCSPSRCPRRTWTVTSSGSDASSRRTPTRTTSSPRIRRSATTTRTTTTTMCCCRPDCFPPPLLPHQRQHQHQQRHRPRRQRRQLRGRWHHDRRRQPRPPPQPQPQRLPSDWRATVAASAANRTATSARGRHCTRSSDRRAYACA